MDEGNLALDQDACRDRACVHAERTGHSVTDAVDDEGRFLIACDRCEWLVVAECQPSG